MKIKEYIKQREGRKTVKTQAGPVITISRDFGCRANEIAKLLISEMESHRSPLHKPQPWRVLNKEFLRDAAKSLHLKPHLVEHVLQPHEKSLVEDFLASYSRDYVIDLKLIKSIKNLISSYAEEGNLIIVGRAGVAVTRSMERSLHLKLEAPLAWRVAYLSESRNLSLDEALELAHQIDQRRQLFISQIRKEPYEEALFDAVFNRATLTTDAIVKSILPLLQSKQII